MTRRRAFLLGFGFIALVLTGAIAWQLYQVRDSCMNVASGGSCPTLADVGNVRYTVSTGQELLDAERALTPYGSITQTNVPQQFAEMQVYALSDIDPAALLVARANEAFDPGDGPYRLLFRLGGNRDGVWPALCDYLMPERRATQPECEAVT
jgi:hypothetical protein